MGDTAERAQQLEPVEQTGKRRRSRGGDIAVVVVLMALALGAAYYGEELSTYWRLRGWDTGAVKGMMERFVREAHEGKPSAGELLDPAWVQPVIEGGKLVGVSQTSARGPTTARFETVVPAGTIKECAVRIKNRSRVFQADVQFPNGQWGQFDVDRVQGALRIRSVPIELSSTRPQPQPWD